MQERLERLEPKLAALGIAGRSYQRWQRRARAG